MLRKCEAAKMGRRDGGEAIMSYFGKDDPRLEDIRRRSQDAAAGEDWGDFRAMEGAVPER
jgi:hypothetical protein